MRMIFVTATPLSVERGSGTYTGLAALMNGLKKLGHEVGLCRPQFNLPVFTLQRWIFNRQLRTRRWEGWDCVVGVDLDGYQVAGRTGKPHVATIKGVVADEMRFEKGLTRWTMGIQARWEKLHVKRADLVVTTSDYAARRIQELYGVASKPRIVPEAIEIETWRRLMSQNPPRDRGAKFTVLTVSRFYPRKRLDVLLKAAARMRSRIPGLEVRIVGDGPERPRLRRLWRQMRLEGTVLWLGNVSQQELAREYQSCDVFCLPSVQEGFGIVFLEAMLAGKPIVAARAAAAPEVARYGLLAEPDDEVTLAEAVLKLYESPGLRRDLGERGKEMVQVFDAPRVARQFLEVVGEVL